MVAATALIYTYVSRRCSALVQRSRRRFQISNAPRICPLAPPKGPNHLRGIIEESGSYVPRCVTPVVKRTEYYSSRSKEFWLSVRYDIKGNVAGRSERVFAICIAPLVPRSSVGSSKIRTLYTPKRHSQQRGTRLRGGDGERI